MVERSPAPLQEQLGRGSEAVAAPTEALTAAVERSPGRDVEDRAETTEPGLQLGEIGCDEAGRCSGGRGPHIGGKIAQGCVLLVTDGRDDGHGAGRDRPHDGLVAERQQVVEAASAAGDDDDIYRGVGCDPA